jgi:hypothetical protein
VSSCLPLAGAVSGGAEIILRILSPVSSSLYSLWIQFSNL